MGKAACETAVRVPGIVFADNGGYVAGSPLLDIYSQGATEEEAVSMAQDAINTMLEHWAEQGALEGQLRKRGLEAVTEEGFTRWAAPAGAVVIPDDLIQWGYSVFKVVLLEAGPIATPITAATEG